MVVLLLEWLTRPKESSLHYNLNAALKMLLIIKGIYLFICVNECFW